MEKGCIINPEGETVSIYPGTIIEVKKYFNGIGISFLEIPSGTTSIEDYITSEEHLANNPGDCLTFEGANSVENVVLQLSLLSKGISPRYIDTVRKNSLWVAIYQFDPAA